MFFLIPLPNNPLLDNSDSSWTEFRLPAASSRARQRPHGQLICQGESVRFRPRCGSPEGRTGAAEVRECHALQADGEEQVPQGDVNTADEPESDQEWDSCPVLQCFHTHKQIGRAWLETRNPFGKHWNDLVHSDRVFLLEVACGPQSLLTEEVLNPVVHSVVQSGMAMI